MNLTQWIEKNGVTGIANYLKINRSVVGHWKGGKVLPRPEMMQVIVKRTKGQITYAEMIEEYLTESARIARLDKCARVMNRKKT